MWKAFEVNKSKNFTIKLNDRQTRWTTSWLQKSGLLKKFQFTEMENASYSKSINAFGGRGLKKGKLPM